MEGLIRWFSRNHVAGNFLMLAVVLAGFVTWFELRKEIFPETSLDAAMVRVPYPNATPEEVETGICMPIEEAIADVEGIEKVTSTAALNVGMVMAEIATGYDTRDVMDDIKSKVDAVDNLAENAERPVIEELLLKRQVMSVAVSADTDERTLRRIAEDVRDGLLTYQAPPPEGLLAKIGSFLRGPTDITQVELAAVRPYEISIEVSEAALRQYGLTLAGVADAVRRSSLDLPGGSVRTESGEIIFRAVGKRYRGSEFEDIVVQTRPDGSVLLLRDVARVVDGFEDVDLDAHFDGRAAVLVNVFRVGDQDTLALTRMVRRFLEEEQQRLPEGVELEVWNDESIYLDARLNLLAKNAVFGLVLVLVVLALFLRPSLAALVALGIPVSFAGGIWLMPMMGISINMISLFAFILVLGIVVDDATIVGENVYTRIQRGEDPRVAAWKGTHEVGVVVIFGVLTTMMAFTPMLGISGVSGKIWPNIPLVVIPTLAFSLVQSKLVLPAHLAFLRPRRDGEQVGFITRVQRRVATGLEQFIAKIYVPFLSRALRARYVVVAAFVAMLLLCVGYVGGGWIQTKFMPDVEADLITASLELPEGVPFSRTEEAVRRIERAAMELGEEYRTKDGGSILVHVLASAGSQPFLSSFEAGGPPTATHLGQVNIELVPSVQRSVSADELAVKWRERVGAIPGAVELTFQAQSGTGGNAIDFNLTGKDMAALEAATAHVKEALADYTGVVDIADSNRQGKEELRFDTLTPQGRALGFRLEDVARQVRAAFYGDEVQRLQRGRDEVKVMVRYPQDERRSLENLERMKLRTPEGDEVPLPQVVELDYGSGPATITRVDRQRSIKVTADVDETIGANANEVVERLERDVLKRLPEIFPGVTYSFEGEQKDMRESVRDMSIGFVGALIGMYVLMAIPLRSYFQPMIVMSVIPFGIVGAIAGHVLLGLELSIMSMCGIVALAGVVVNDSLVLVDYVNRRGQEKKTVREAAVAAGAARFRAVLLTSLTTFVGLMPMVLETDMQAAFLIPMAVSLAFGILFATSITLVLVPAIYLVLDDLRALLGRGRSRAA